MQKWEYLQARYLPGELQEVNGVASAKADRKIPVHEWLNQRGEEGWELVTVEGGTAAATRYFFLKRYKL